MATQPLMKDGINEDAIDRITRALIASGAHFSEHDFRKDALTPLKKLELKQRVQHLIAVMGKHLPDHFPDAANILSHIRDHWEEGKGHLRGFAAWPVIDYVAEYGLDHPKIALPLLRYLTPMFSAEFAIRPFLEKHPHLTYNEMLIWCLDTDAHVRRLASEGIRPRLPWGKQLTRYIDDPSEVLTLLDTLKDDPSDYVRRSVGNNLNDISKDHPELVLELCQRWKSEKVSARRWIIQRATRTLVKSGHPKVFPLLGFTARPRVNVSAPQLSTHDLQLGETLSFSTQITSTSSKNQRIVVDYAIHYVKANGKTAAKIFKGKNLTLKPGKTTTLEKSQTFKKITTRQHYSGTHTLEILINGKSRAASSFTLHA